MKLNLLPTYVGRGKQLAVSIVLGVMMILVCFGISFVMVKSAQAQLDDVTAQAKAFEPKVDESKYSGKEISHGKNRDSEADGQGDPQ